MYSLIQFSCFSLAKKLQEVKNAKPVYALRLVWYAKRLASSPKINAMLSEAFSNSLMVAADVPSLQKETLLQRGQVRA